MRALSLLAVPLLLAVLVSLPASAPPDKEWTFLVYMDADNNLEGVGIDDFLEMSAIGSTADVNVVVQFDRARFFDTQYGDWWDARRFYITPGMVPNPQDAIANLGEVNMADPASLVSFVNWGIANYPAHHYFLVLWDHGDGWQGVVIDDDPVTGDRLTALELRSALDAISTANGGRRIDLLGNDACRMSLEIQYELKDYVDFFVGSEKDEPLAGWPYDALLSRVVADPQASPVEVAGTLVDVYVESYMPPTNSSLYSVALSAVSAEALRPLAAGLNGFLDELDVHRPYFTEQVVQARAATEHYEIGGGPGGDEYDLRHFVENVLERIPSRRLERRAADLLAAIDGAVVHNRAWDHPNPVNQVSAAHANGISLWFPSVPDAGYTQLSFSADTTWDEFLASYAVGQRRSLAANATAHANDTTGDGLADELVVRFQPAVAGAMAIDVYRDGAHAFSRAYATAAGRTDEFRYGSLPGGEYEVSFYLLEAGDLVNHTVVSGVAVEELVTFRGQVTADGGSPIDGATVTLVNVRTGARASGTTAGGAYAIQVAYPTWFRLDDPLALEARVGDRVARVTFNATVPADRVVVQDLSLDSSGMGPWLAALAVLAVVAAVGASGAVYFWWRLRRFKRPPT